MLTCDNWSELQTEFAFFLYVFCVKQADKVFLFTFGDLAGWSNLSLQGKQQAAFVSDKTQVLRQNLEKQKISVLSRLDDFSDKVAGTVN